MQVEIHGRCGQKVGCCLLLVACLLFARILVMSVGVAELWSDPAGARAEAQGKTVQMAPVPISGIPSSTREKSLSEIPESQSVAIDNIELEDSRI